MICPECEKEMAKYTINGCYYCECHKCHIRTALVNSYKAALEQIKAAVQQNECSISGCFALRADVKEILAEAGI